MSKVTIIDYGMGNLLSVCRAFEHLGAEIILTHNPEKIAHAELLVLPGVGAFGDGMQALNDKGLSDSIKNYAQKGKPLLGICLGAQMLLDSSDEFGSHQGLGLISGKVVAIPHQNQQGHDLNVPHMGWADLQPANNDHFSHPLLDSTANGSALYFVHSFHVQTEAQSDLVATCDYSGNQLTAVVQHDNVVGCQFHPEKSGPVGLNMLKNFLELAA